MLWRLYLFGCPYLIKVRKHDRERTVRICGISERRVQKLCEENRIPGISKIGYLWLIPQNAEKPKDNRKKADT